MNITCNQYSVALNVKKYLKEKHNIDFVTTRTKIFSLAPKLKRAYKDERLVSCETFAENLYKLYKEIV